MKVRAEIKYDNDVANIKKNKMFEKGKEDKRKLPSQVNQNPYDRLLDHVRTDYRNMQIREIMHLSPRALLGINDEQAKLLQKLEIKTVFDLATSQIFDAATKLLKAGTDVHSVFTQHGAATSDLVRESYAAGKKVQELRFLPVHVIQSLPEEHADEVQRVLSVQTVRDLALYPPYVAAVKMLNAIYFPENEEYFDPERPADLLPKTGEYPTERVQYTTLLMDEIKMDDGEEILSITSPKFQPIDLARLKDGDSGFKKVAFGALLTINQSWYAQGVTLGQLLHSTALAPGESTRIAVIDWSRKSRAGQTETIGESDSLSNEMSHNRSISEVTQAVANEAQSGFSGSKSSSFSTEAGMSEAFEASAPLGGLLGGPSGSVGHTFSTASSQASSESYSTSFGHREIGSEMLQNVNDRTHQHAHSSRSRRASVVKEVSQTEHEEVSTRVIANYNHMHALTIQYYEVVQVYRVETSIVKADKVIFIPMKLIDFNDDSMVRRFQNVLIRHALSHEMREALHNLDVIEIAPYRETNYKVIDGFKFGDIIDSIYQPSIRKDILDKIKGLDLRKGLIEKNVDLNLKANTLKSNSTNDDNQSNQLIINTNINAASQILQINSSYQALQLVNHQLWKTDQVSRLSNLLNLPVLRKDSTAIHLPSDVTVVDCTADGGNVALDVIFHMRQGESVEGNKKNLSLRLSEVRSIAVRGSDKEQDITATVTLTLNRNGVLFPVELPSVTVAKGNAYDTTVVTLNAGSVNKNLKKHLNDNQMHYSQAIFRSLDSSQIALLLSGYGTEVDGKTVPVAQVVQPQPIRYIGNYLAFKMNTDMNSDAQWASWMKEHGIQLGVSKEDIIPLPSGGTFAEAVLGRSNSAEKLDATRFWNWQDSPIPLQPAQIADIQTGSRATNEDVAPGQLSSPIINIMNPSSLPDPAGTAAILAAIQNGGMFRDMSGLQDTIALTKAALEATQAGAASAGQQAGANMNNLLKANTERQGIAADMIKSLANTAAQMYTGGAAGGGGSGGGRSGSTHSEEGARINYFDRTRDNSSGSGAGGSSGAGGAGNSGSGGSGGSGGAGGSGSGSGSSGGGTNRAAGGNASNDGYTRNPAALAATWGDSGSPTEMLERLVSTAANLLNNDAPVPDAAMQAPWPHLDESQVISRIQQLKQHPHMFNQGALGLCTAAAFYRHMILRDPEGFENFATTLYRTGSGYLGELHVRPGLDLRRVNYSALVASTPNFPPQADWMLMSALRDSENWFFDFEGTTDESFAIRTSAKELSEWYEETGLYVSVEFTEERSLEKIKEIRKTSNNHIALWIRVSLLQPVKGTHIITLESPMVIDEAADTITFDYWTWGQPVRTGTFRLSEFEAAYLGAITAAF